MRRYISTFIAVIIIIGLIIYWVEEHNTEQSVTAFHRAAVPVSVVSVKRQVVPDEIHAVGTLEARREVDIAPQIAGLVSTIAYTPGSLIKAGKLLIQLDDRIFQAKLKSAESVLTLAKMDYHRVISLAGSGAASQQLLDQKRAAYQQAIASVTTNNTYLAETAIRAPFAGYVGAQNVNVGDYVQKGEKLTTLTDRSELRVDYQVSERYLPLLALGQKVNVTVPNEPNIKMHGKVSYISPIIDDTTHSLAVEATIPNQKNILAPGLFVKVNQTVRINRDALVVPQASIVPTITGPKIFIIQKKKAKLVSVKTGSSFSNLIEVRAGLHEGDVVVIAGQQRLEDGVSVKEVVS